MSKAGRKTKRHRRPAAAAAPALTFADFIYRRLTGDSTGLAPIEKAQNDLRLSY